jgi:hypothetical protein
MAKRLDDDGDLLLRALRALPSLEPSPEHDRHIAARASAARRAWASRAARWSRPLIPVSVGTLTLSYLVWAVHQAAWWLGR